MSKKNPLIIKMQDGIDSIHVQGGYSTVNLIWKIRFFISSLLIGKKSVIGNCKLINVEAIVNSNCFIFGNVFIRGKNIPDRKSGMTLRPAKSRGKK